MSEKFWEFFNEVKPQLWRRTGTFTFMFEHLDALDHPVSIVETGCMRDPGNFSGDGCSTLLFDRYVQCNGGTVTSIDIDSASIERCRGHVNGQTTLINEDSLTALARLAKGKPRIDLLYLDSLYDAEHIMKEFDAILPALDSSTLVVVDDCPRLLLTPPKKPEIMGKGALLAKYAEAIGATQMFSAYQAGWVGMAKGETKVSDEFMFFRSAVDAFNSEQYQKVITLSSKAIEEDPKNYRAWVLRGAALIHLDSLYAAILNFDRALAVEPDLPQALNNRGIVYVKLGMFEEGVADFKRAIELTNFWASHFQLAMFYGATEEPEKAEFHFRQAITHFSDFDPSKLAAIHVFLGTLLQGLGRWKEGFEEDQHRNKLLDYKQKTVAPPWRGEDLSQKHILLFAEAGWGDKILSLRYVNLLAERYPGVKIIIGVPKSLARLTKTSFDMDVTERADTAADFSCSLLDVPMVLNLTWMNVPRPEKYLSADQELSNYWKDKLKEVPRGLNVGLCWASFNGISKTIPGDHLMELGGVPHVNLISLQVPKSPISAKIRLHDWTDEIKDWADTAALVDNLDLILTVDTAVAHLAGALGKPVWNIVRYSTYWPWLSVDLNPSPSYSIWYPSMQLFRQREASDWLTPIRKAVLQLQRKIVGIDFPPSSV